MASAVLSSVLTTASRFALLQVDSGSGSDSEPGKGKGRSNGKPQALGNKPTTTNEKKREKRRKKKEQQQSEANEVAIRALCFPGPVRGSCTGVAIAPCPGAAQLGEQKPTWSQV